MRRFVDGIAALSLQRNGIDVLPTGARVALPARFAARGAGMAGVGDGGPGTQTDNAGRSAAPPADAPANHRGWSGHPARGAETAADHDGPPPFAPTRSVVLTQPGVAAAPLRHAPVQEGGNVLPALPGERAEASFTTPMMAAAHASGQRSSPAATDPRTSRPRASSPVPLATLDRSRPMVDAGARTVARAPLRESTVAERTGARPDERPVIHVTIDRIDVHAPAAAARPAPARGRTPPQPSVSLADYLRGKGRTGSSP